MTLLTANGTGTSNAPKTGRYHRPHSALGSRRAVCWTGPGIVFNGVAVYQHADPLSSFWWRSVGVRLSLYEALYPPAPGISGGGLRLEHSDGLGGPNR